MSASRFFLLAFFGFLFIVGCSKEDEEKIEEEIEDKTPETFLFDQISRIEIPGSSTTDVWGFTRNGEEYAVVGDYGNDGNFSIVNVTDPSNLSIVSTTSYRAFDMKVWQNYLYVVDGTHDARGENSGVIYDISNPEAPVMVGNFPSSHNIFIDERGYLYLSGRHEIVDGEEVERGITIYDLNNNPAQPQEVWTSDLSESHDIAVIDERMFDFHGTWGTFIYDVSNPAAPVLLGRARTGIGYDHSGWTTEDGNFLFVTNELAASSQYDFSNAGGPDISIWDITDVSSPVPVGQIHDESSRVHNLYIVGDLAYISYYSAGFKVFDVANPIDPVLLYSYDTDGAINPETFNGFNGAFGVYPFSNSGNIYVSDTSTDLHIFKPN